MWPRVALAGSITAIAFVAGLSFAGRGSIRKIQQGATQDLAVGKLLVAKPELADPNFAESVVLLVHYDDEKGAVGLILNRRTKVTLAKVLPNVKGAKDDPVYEGGPVETATAQALFRSREKPEGASRVLGDVYASGSKDVIEKFVSSGAKPSEFRLYAGYAGWAPGQLETEIAVGGWSVLRANVVIVFDEDTDSLWPRLQHAAGTRIAYCPPAVGVGASPSLFCRFG